MTVISQKVFLIALGIVLRGLGVSEAARPTGSVPANAKAAGRKKEQKPFNPFAKAPGSCQYFAPMYWLYAPLAGPPPQLRTTEMNMNMTTTKSLRHDDQNSSSAYPSVPKTLIATIASCGCYSEIDGQGDSKIEKRT